MEDRPTQDAPGVELQGPDAGQVHLVSVRLLADAAADKGRKPGSYHGYSYRILTAQGQDAPGGARSYLADGRMTGGFGLLAWPTTYGKSGIMSFMINQDGQVYEKNLGTGTTGQVARIKTFNPDATWRKVTENQ